MINFRIDDIGASTKIFSAHHGVLGRYVFNYLKTEKFRLQLPYKELTLEEWSIFFDIFQEYNVVPIIAVTASWVDEKSNLIPFPEKFPEEANFLKKMSATGRVVIANHGLTHCVIGKHLPNILLSNRRYQREFWPYLDQSIHDEHIMRSQHILESYFGKPITIFVPPGNVWSIKTYRALKNTDIRQIISRNYMFDSDDATEGIEFICDRNEFFVCHDRELKILGSDWLKKTILGLVNT